MVLPTFNTGLARNRGESLFPNLWDGLVGLWSPEIGKQGQSLFDFSLRKHDATLVGISPSADYLAGKYGYAIDYDGNEDYIDIGNIPEIDDASQDLTIMMRVKTTNASNNCFFYYDTNNALSPSTDFYCYTPSAIKIGGIGTGSEISTGVSGFNDGNWHDLVVRLYDTELALFKDGVKVFSTVVAHNHANYGSSHNFRVCDNANVSFLSGQVGEVRVYNRALQDNEILSFTLGSSPLTPLPILSPSNIPAASQEELETIEISDNIITQLIGGTIEESESIVIDDSIEAKVVGGQAIINETIEISDSISAETFTNDATKVLSFNPLIYVTNTSPAKIVKVDISDPENPTEQIQSLTSFDFALDVAHSPTLGFFYIACADGKICKVNDSDITSFSELDTGDTDALETIEIFDSFGQIYAGTGSAVGELYIIDERNTFNIDTDIKVLTTRRFDIDTEFHLIQSIQLDTDIRVIATNTFNIDCDVKVLDPEVSTAPSGTEPLDAIIPVKLTDYHIYLDSVELENTDLILESITVTHTIDAKSQATFQLARRHDQLNIDPDGNTKTITNQNEIEIKVKGVSIFNGTISQVEGIGERENEHVLVTCIQDQPQEKFNNVILSLASLTERVSLYHIYSDFPRIFNPVIDENDENPVRFKGIQVDLGTEIKQRVSRYTVFDSTGSIAEDIQNGDFIPIQNWTYFWSPTVQKSGVFDIKTESNVTQASSSSPFHSLKLPAFRLPTIHPFTNLASGDTSAIHFLYIGTSLSPVSEDLWNLTNAKHRRQRIYEDEETELGTYTIGSAPFDIINPRNGRKITKFRWVDEDDGLYSIKDASYNYENFAKKVADLEYQKLLNINGQVLPETSCIFTLTIDAYLFYDLNLLTRINIDNTITSNIYNSNNGFPVAIKSISITSADRKVILECDNLKSSVELEEIDGQFPDDEDQEYIENEKRILIAPKSDMRSRLKVQ